MVRYMYMDVAAFLLLFLMVIFGFYRKMYVQKSSKIFMLEMFVCMGACLFDIFSVFPDFVGLTGSWICTTGYFILRASMPVIYLGYVMAFTDPNREKRVIKKYLIIMVIPYLLLVALLLINPLLPNNLSVFYYTDGVKGIVYERGPLITLAYLGSAVYLIAGIIWIVKYYKFFEKPELIAIIAIFPLTLVSVIIQMVRKELLVELFVTSLALVLVQVVIERQEVLIDPRTGLKSKKLFKDYIKRSYAFKRNSYVILINVSNFNEIYNLVSYDESRKYILNISSMLQKKYKIIDSNYETFNIDSGTYALLFNNLDSAVKTSEVVLSDLSNNRFANTKYHPDVNICIISSPDDFESEDKLLLFASNFYSRFNMNNKITLIKDIKNDNNFIITNNIDEIIDTALEEDEIEVYYQPIINMKNKKFKSAEALVRLNSKKYGFINPGLFIPYAEKNGRISDIDTVVMKKVFKFIASEEFIKLGLDYIEINLSMVDCMDNTLADRIIGLMKEYNISPKSINLEITESYDSLNNEASRDNIHKLEQYGINFSLDDYGTGYSNIERFSKFPIKIVKIDKSLVDLANEESMKMVLKNTFKLISELRRETVVEGVETEEQVVMFEELGCNYIQGYYFSKPLPLNDFITFIGDKNN